MSIRDRLNKMYRNKHNGREVLCTDVAISDFGIYTWTLRGNAGQYDLVTMTERDMCEHWVLIEEEDDLMDSDNVVTFKGWKEDFYTEEGLSRYHQIKAKNEQKASNEEEE
tara:strand:+ start:92 stop:421 length:330 start_codon:yes stop_codon:yes gene_type:complete